MALTTAQTAALHTELTTDPRGYGYAALVTSGDDNGLASLLNLTRDGSTGTVPTNPTGAGGAANGVISVNRGTITTQELVEGIVQSEFAALTQGQRDWVSVVAAGSRVRVDTSSTARAGLLALFGAGTTTRTNLTASASRSGSRAEELFGTNVQVQPADCGAAR